MTFYREPHIACDWPMCYLDSRQDLQVYADSAAKIRTILVAMNWTRVLNLDFCDHHPDLGNHVPTLTPEKSSVWADSVRASCSCGWRDTESTWAPERKMAIQRWKDHLPEEPDCFKKIKEIQTFGVHKRTKPRDKESPS